MNKLRMEGAANRLTVQNAIEADFWAGQAQTQSIGWMPLCGLAARRQHRRVAGRLRAGTMSFADAGLFY